MTKNQADQVNAAMLLEEVHDRLTKISRMTCFDPKSDRYIADMALGVKHLQNALAPPVRVITILGGYPNVEEKES